MSRPSYPDVGVRHSPADQRELSPRLVRPRQWPTLADDLFRIMHDDGFEGGRLRVGKATAAMGLGGALLAELVWHGHIDLLADGTVVVASRATPADAAAHEVFAEIAGRQSEISVETWVSELADRSYGLVAKRMVRSGQVREEDSRRWWRTTRVYPPVNIIATWWASAGLAGRHRRGQLTDFDRVLTGLVCVVGRADHVFFELPKHEIATLPRVADSVAPPLPHLIRHVRAIVTGA